MEGTIVNFRRGVETVKGNQMIVKAPGVDDKEAAAKLVGKKVTWKSPGKQEKVITGEVRGAHGNSGCVRVLFETGMPGQAIGKKVQIA